MREKASYLIGQILLTKQNLVILLGVPGYSTRGPGYFTDPLLSGPCSSLQVGREGLLSHARVELPHGVQNAFSSSQSCERTVRKLPSNEVSTTSGCHAP